MDRNTVFLIPSRTGGGAEKIFSILKNNLDGEFIYIWDIQEGLIKTSIPKSILRRIIQLRYAGFKLRSLIKGRRVRLISFLPLALGVAPFLPSNCEVTYCRRNCYPPLSLNRWLEVLFSFWIGHYIFCSSESRLRTAKPFRVVRNLVPRTNKTRAPGQNLNGDVMIVGRLVKQKRPLLALEVAERLRHVNFEFFGDGPLEQRMRARTIELQNVKLRGFVRSPFIKSDAGILLHCAFYEGSPNAVYEAISAGRVVVCQKGLSGICDLPQEVLDAQIVFIDEARANEVVPWCEGLRAAQKKLEVIWPAEALERFTEGETCFASRFFHNLESLASR